VSLSRSRGGEETVMALYFINGIAAVMVLLGFHIAFRQGVMRTVVARLRHSDGQPQAQAASEDRQGIESVFRIAGVMIMAFSFTAAAFADLIAYYKSVSVY
jgi:hypothetical protein